MLRHLTTWWFSRGGRLRRAARAIVVAAGWVATASASAVVGLGFGAFFLAPRSAVLIHRYHWWENDFIASLEQNLNTLGNRLVDLVGANAELHAAPKPGATLH